jgi:hypothetical protein
VVVKAKVPDRFALLQNYPNPFNTRTTIGYLIPQTRIVQLMVYDLRGTLVRTLANGIMGVGYHSVTWDGRDAEGRPVSSGIYLVRMEVPGISDPLSFAETTRIMLMK